MATAHNLIQPLTRFIGRERELAAVTQVLPTTRLRTLTGAGGAGKTRLALQVATGLLASAQYPNGIWFVDRAPVADPALVPQTVAAALHVRETPARPPGAALLDHLAPRTVLLVLDNCEHLAAAGAHLAQTLLPACPHLRILATSRQARHAPGELVGDEG